MWSEKYEQGINTQQLVIVTDKNKPHYKYVEVVLKN